MTTTNLQETKTMNIGIIGTDTSHASAFTKELNNRDEWGMKVKTAFPAGSPDLKASANRVMAKAAEIKEEFNVELVGNIDMLLERSDAVLILSVDGRIHLPQVKEVFKSGKRVFVDKPFTASLADAKEIIRLSEESGVPFFTCSCVRFQPEIADLKNDPSIGTIEKAQGCSRMNLEKHHPDLFWYGIHGVEAIYTMLGRGCVSVKRPVVEPDEIDFTYGTWEDGRVGVYRGVRDKQYKPIAKIWGSDGVAETMVEYSYTGMLEKIVEFFQTGKVPVDPIESLEIIEYMTAAQVSKERGGAEVTLEEIRAEHG